MGYTNTNKLEVLIQNTKSVKVIRVCTKQFQFFERGAFHKSTANLYYIYKTLVNF